MNNRAHRTKPGFPGPQELQSPSLREPGGERLVSYDGAYVDIAYFS